jgi:hypothetical protein
MWCYGTKIRKILYSGEKRFTKETTVVIWTFVLSKRCVCIQIRKVYASNMILFFSFKNLTNLPRIELRKSKNNTRMAISGSCYGTKIRKILCSAEKQHSKTKFLAIKTFFDSNIIMLRIFFKNLIQKICAQLI